MVKELGKMPPSLREEGGLILDETVFWLSRVEGRRDQGEATVY